MKTGRVVKKLISLGRHDLSRIYSEFTTLNHMIENSSDSNMTITLVKDQWKVLLDAVSSVDRDIVKKAVDTLLNLVENNLILPETVLNLLQHGLVLGLRNTVWKSDIVFEHSLRLLLEISRSMPESLPYLSELMTNSQLYSDMVDKMMMAEPNIIQIIVEFVFHMNEIPMSQLLGTTTTPKPLIPEILLQTGLSKQTAENYNPISTLMRLLCPQFICQVIKTCLTRAYSRDESLVNFVLKILANALKLAHFKSGYLAETDQDDIDGRVWIVNMLDAFRDSDLEASIDSMCNTWRRAITSAEFSEHSSQGIGVQEPASRLLSQSGQFMEFYRQYYGSISATHLVSHDQKHLSPSSTITEESPLPSSQESSSSIFDNQSQ